MMDNRKLLCCVAAWAAMVAVAVFVGCGTRFITVPVTRPAAIDMTDFDTIAIGKIEGQTSGFFSTELTKAIAESDQFKVLSSEALALKRIGSNKATARAALVSGGISVDYDEDRSISTSEQKDEKTGEVKIKRTYRTNGKATATASLSIVDLHTSEVLAVEEFEGSSSAEKTSKSSYPDLREEALFKECRAEIIQSFMRAIAPYTQHVVVFFETDDNMPELERGFRKAQVGDWAGATALFQQATGTYAHSESVHKAYYNLGLSYLYTDQFEPARTALEKAYAGKATTKYEGAIKQLDERIEEKRRLEKQEPIETE